MNTWNNTSNGNMTTWQSGMGTTMPFEAVSEPGCYICTWNGHLLRFPEDAFNQSKTPVVNIVGSTPLFVTKISDNPYLPLTQAKTLAANFDLHVNF